MKQLLPNLNTGKPELMEEPRPALKSGQVLGRTSDEFRCETQGIHRPLASRSALDLSTLWHLYRKTVNGKRRTSNTAVNSQRSTDITAVIERFRSITV